MEHATNSVVFGIMMDLLLEYLQSKGLTQSAQVLQTESANAVVANPNELFGSRSDVSKLEALLAEPLLSQIEAAAIVPTQAAPPPLTFAVVPSETVVGSPLPQAPPPASTPATTTTSTAVVVPCDTLAVAASSSPSSSSSSASLQSSSTSTSTLSSASSTASLPPASDVASASASPAAVAFPMALSKPFDPDMVYDFTDNEPDTADFLAAIAAEEDEWSDDDSAGYFFTLVDDLSYKEHVVEGEVVAEQRNRFEIYTQSNAAQQTALQYESYDLKIIQTAGRTGFEPTKDFPIVPKTVIAGRYMIEDLLGQAAFSRAVLCKDLKTEQYVCVKIITNNKDFFDQSIDEIKLLMYLNKHGDPDEKCFLKLYDFFYHKEHLFIVCELLKDNLYEFYKYNFESGDELYFNMPRIRYVCKQILTALKYVHGMNIIHCDLKPENILIKSYSRCEVKVIDFGSSCFTTDHLSSYVQSRSYRAPEVMIGLPYDCKVDIWSLGCIVAELFMGNVLFLNDSIPTLLGRINAIVGPFPESMRSRARYYRRYYTEDNVLFELRPEGTAVYIHPKRTSLRKRIKCSHKPFLDFLEQLLQIDPSKRPTAAQALNHPFITAK